MSLDNGRGGKTEDPSGSFKNDGTGGKYRMGGMDTEESAADSAKWSAKETEESASGGKANTTGGSGEVRTKLTPTAEGPEGSGVETGLGGTADGEAPHWMRPPWKQTQREWGPAMGRKIGKGKGLTIGESSDPGGDRQGGGGGVELPRGTKISRVEELPRGGGISGVNRVPGTEGQGQGGDGNSPATQDNEGSSSTSRGEEMGSDQELAVLSIAQWIAADR